MRRGRTLWIALVLGSWIPIACGREPGGVKAEAGAGSADSASATSAALEPALVDTLYVVGGVAEQGLIVYQLSAAVLLPNGRAAFAHGDGLVLVDEGGQVVRRLAGVGEGPGEVRGVRTMTWDESAERLLYYDSLLRRITRLDIASGSAETRPFDALGLLADALPLADWGVLLSRPLELAGRFTGGSPRTRRPEGVHAFVDTLLVEVIDSAGSRVRLAALPMGLRYSVRTGNNTTTRPAPGARGLLASSAGRAIAFAYSDAPQVTVLDEEGRSWSTSAGVSQEPMTDPLWARVQERYAPPVGDSAPALPSGLPPELRETLLRQRRAKGDVPSAVRILEVAEKPEWKPLFDRIHLSVDGDVWLREYQIDDSLPSARWHVVGREGVQRLVSLPSELRVLSIRGQTVLARAADELGVETLIALSVREGG